MTLRTETRCYRHYMGFGLPRVAGERKEGTLKAKYEGAGSGAAERAAAPEWACYFAGLSQPCIAIQRANSSNQPVLVVDFWYMPKPWPPCS